MKLYHGSYTIVQQPQILESNRLLDFGIGFYTTTNEEQAERWAKRVSFRKNTKDQYISIYEIDIEKVKLELNFIEFNESDEKWLDFVCLCRNGRNTCMNYDLVIGPVADDNVYTTVKLYETKVLSKEEAIKRLKVEKLFNQILFHTEQSLLYCKFIGSKSFGGDIVER